MFDDQTPTPTTDTSEVSLSEESWNTRIDIRNSFASSSRITLNVGGKLFTTTKDTLLSRRDSFFYAMLSSGQWFPDESDGTYFIDRDPDYFHIILSFLRTGNVFGILELNDLQRKALKHEADFYCLSDLMNGVEQQLFDDTISFDQVKFSHNNRRATMLSNDRAYFTSLGGVSNGKFTWKFQIVVPRKSSVVGWVGVMEKKENTYSAKYIESKWSTRDVVTVDLYCDEGKCVINSQKKILTHTIKCEPLKLHYLYISLMEQACVVLLD